MRKRLLSCILAFSLCISMSVTAMADETIETGQISEAAVEGVAVAGEAAEEDAAVTGEDAEDEAAATDEVVADEAVDEAEADDKESTEAVNEDAAAKENFEEDAFTEEAVEEETAAEEPVAEKEEATAAEENAVVEEAEESVIEDAEENTVTEEMIDPEWEEVSEAAEEADAEESAVVEEKEESVSDENAAMEEAVVSEADGMEEAADEDKNSESEETAEEISVLGNSTSGTCGENLTWTLVDGTLTISGTGAMYDYGETVEDGLPPWDLSEGINSTEDDSCYPEKNNRITSVVVSNGVTHIGSYAFRGLKKVTSFRLADSVTSIGKAAFQFCSSFTNITLPKRIKVISEELFDSCNNLKEMTIPDGVTRIEDSAFSWCYGLTIVHIPESVKYLGEYTFIADSVETVYYSGTKKSWEAVEDAGSCLDCDNIIFEKQPPVISTKSVSLYANNTKQLKVYYSSGTISWSSSNKSVATVSSSGKITAKKSGTAVITASVSGVKLTCKVTVKKPVISAKSVSLYSNKTKQLKVTHGYGKIKWSSSNKSVATVSSSGKITAKKSGTAVITASVSGVKLTCKVTVKKPVISKKSVSLYITATQKLKVTGAYTKVKWSSSNESVATVDSKGKVTAINAGTAKITGKIGSDKVTCKVTVKSPKLSKTSITTRVNLSKKLKVSGGFGEITWISSNPEIATVNSSGKVTGVCEGNATIYAIRNGVTLACSVTVKSNVYSTSVNTNAYDYRYGEPKERLGKAYFRNGVLYAEIYVINARMFQADYFDWWTIELSDSEGNTIAKKYLGKTNLYLAPYGYTVFTITFSGSEIKRSNVDLSKGVSYSDDWYYTYSY